MQELEKILERRQLKESSVEEKMEFVENIKECLENKQDDNYLDEDSNKLIKLAVQEFNGGVIHELIELINISNQKINKSDTLDDIVEQLQETQDTKKTLEDAIDRIKNSSYEDNELFKHMAKIYRENEERLSPVLDELVESKNEVLELSDSLSDLKITIEQCEERIKEIYYIGVNNGWYIYKITSELLEKIKSDSTVILTDEDIDEYMENLIDKDLEIGIKELKQNFSEFAFMIDRLFINYSSENYCESTILGLILTDGIGSLLFNKSIHCKNSWSDINNKINDINQRVNKKINLMKMSLFTEIGAINKNYYGDINGDNLTENRHRIIHGKNPSFYDKKQSKKIISILLLFNEVDKIINA